MSLFQTKFEPYSTEEARKVVEELRLAVHAEGFWQGSVKERFGRLDATLARAGAQQEALTLAVNGHYDRVREALTLSRALTAAKERMEAMWDIDHGSEAVTTELHFGGSEINAALTASPETGQVVEDIRGVTAAATLLMNGVVLDHDATSGLIVRLDRLRALVGEADDA